MKRGPSKDSGKRSVLYIRSVKRNSTIGTITSTLSLTSILHSQLYVLRLFSVSDGTSVGSRVRWLGL